MAKARSKPFERFGNHILFKKIDSDSFGELWRVAAIEGKQVGPLLALRKLTGEAAAMAGAVTAASPLVGEASGAALVRNQKYGVTNGEAFITWEYGGGRSLRHIADRAREAGHVPIPTDQALSTSTPGCSRRSPIRRLPARSGLTLLPRSAEAAHPPARPRSTRSVRFSTSSSPVRSPPTRRRERPSESRSEMRP